MKRLADTAALLVVGRAASQAALLGLILVLVRLLPREAFGVYEAILLAVSTGVVFGAFGIQPSYLYFLPRLEPRERRPFVTQSLLLQLALSVPAGGVALLLGMLFFDLPQAGRSDLAAVLLLGFPAVQLGNRALELIFVALERPGAAAAVAVATSLAVFAAAAGGAWWLGTPNATVAGYLGAQGLVTAIGLRELYRSLPESDRWIATRTQGWEQITYAFPLWLSSLAGDLNRRLDSFLLSTFWPMSTFAVYKVGAREVPLVRTVTSQLTNTVLPSISRAAQERDFGEALRLWHWAIRHTSLVILPVFAFLICFTEPFIVVLFTEEYADASVIFGIYLLLLPLRITSYGGILSGLGRTRPVARAAGLGLAVNIAFSVLLIPVLGWAGPAVATVVAQAAGILFLVRHLRDALETSWADLLPWGTLAHVSLVSGAPALLLAWVLQVTSAVHLAGAALAYGASFALLAWSTGLLTAAELAVLGRWLRAATPTGEP